MLPKKKHRARWRALLTDTLPYEVPVTFSNDVFFAAQLSVPTDDGLMIARQKLLTACRPGSTPYSYSIQKDRGQTTDLGIIHPVWQARISEFYEAYSQSLLDYTTRSEFSLRRPVAQTPIFSEAELAGETTFKLGIAHADPADGEVDVSHVRSYFAYGKYNLLGKFIDSPEFLRLEKRFSRLRTLDVSRCFSSIYTHTVTWAVKGRGFAKENRDEYSFERQLDHLMQQSNYSETHGIVIGPEFSRIFAEIIFQDIDRQLLQALNEKTPGRDYAVRRYVDDYFIFSNSDTDLDLIQRILEVSLSEYKLFLNTAKSRTHERPFVSGLTLARGEMRESVSALYPLFNNVSECTDSNAVRQIVRSIRAEMSNIRLIAARHDVGLHTLSGWLLSSLRRVVRRLVTSDASSQEQREGIADALNAVLGLVFYVCALDVRVRTTYSLCQVFAQVKDFAVNWGGDFRDRLYHLLSEELQLIIRGHLLRAQDQEQHDSVELYNLLICGARFIGPDFLRAGAARDAMSWLISLPDLTYFRFSSLKVCCLTDISAFGSQLAVLNQAARLKVLTAGLTGVSQSAEIYLLFSDYLSSPDVPVKDRSSLYSAILGGTPSNAIINEVQRITGFTDWYGLRIEHLLARKELRPVYAWA